MKLVTVDDLRDGDVLANDVLLEDYTIVLTKGTVIKEPFIEKLRELEVFTVYIEEQQEQEQPAEPQPPKKEPAINAKKQTPKEQPPLSYTEPKIPMEKITILRDDVEEQVRNKIKDILELHVYQRTENLKKIAETAQNIIADILIALKLGLSDKDVYDISVSSLIHDLGLRYLVVRYEDQDINLLPAKDQEEYKKHSIYGYTAIKNEDWLSENAKNIVLNHHEHKDGSGFPLGNDVMSRMTQIVGVCDEFDELICGVGKARVRVHEAVNMVRNYSGIWYDEDIVETFLQLIAVYPVGSRVKTSDGEVGIVMRQNARFPERPVLRIVEDCFGQVMQVEKFLDLVKDTKVVIQNVIK